MKLVVRTLTLLLLVQGLLVAAIYWPQTAILDLRATAGLLTFDPDTVDQIYISDNHDNEILLLRTGDRWRVPDTIDFPADVDAVNTLLQTLAEAQGLWPVADTVAARQRFQVAAYHYQRRLTLIADGELLGSIFLGTSPAYRKVHARNEVSDNIFEVEFSVFDAAAHINNWLDKRLLGIRTPMDIVADTYSLRRIDSEWIADGRGLAEAREVDALISTLRNLTVAGLAEEDAVRTLSSLDPALILDISGLAGKHHLELFQFDKQYFIYSENYGTFFSISAYDFDRLLSIQF